MSAKHRSHGWRMLRLKIDGMHCANCEVLIERRFKKIAGVRRVKVSSTTGMAEINCYGDIDAATLQNAVADDGYTVWLLNERTSKPSDSAATTNTGRDYVEITAAFVILFGLYLLLGQFDVLPENLTLSKDVSYGFALLIGVVASMSTCIAVTGGLLLAVAAKYNSATTQLTAVQRFKPHLFFNAGRVASYALFGGAIGALGSTFSMSAGANALLMILASIIMIVLGLQMLNLFPWLKRLQPRMPKFLAHKIHDLSEKEVRGGAFLLGASTFFLPCGFTQALQLYVLAKGSFTTGALTMLAFSLGTLPALISLSALSSFAKGSFQRYFLKFAGAAVVILGLFNLQSGFTLSAVSADAPTLGEAKSTSQPSVPLAPIVDGKQIVDMKAIRYTYEPHQFAVVAGVPVEWRIDARYAAGCGRILIAPKIGIRKFLSYSDVTVISFTPRAPGEIYFNCGMGMMTRGSKFVVSANAPVAAAAPTVAPLPVAAAAPAAAALRSSPHPQALSSDQRAEVERITKEYLLAHPEVLQEAMAELVKRQQAADAEAHQAAVKENAATLFGSQHQVVLGNPLGDVTVVEFFDYNCAYCKRALADMLDLLKTDSKLKIVLKEFPVLGEGSTQVARVAVAVRMQDETGKKYIEFHQKLLGGRGQADRVRALAVAKEIGLDMARLERDVASDEVKATIEESMKLAEALGVNGTPSYVVGSDVVVGAVGLDALREKVSAVRK